MHYSSRFAEHSAPSGLLTHTQITDTVSSDPLGWRYVSLYPSGAPIASTNRFKMLTWKGINCVTKVSCCTDLYFRPSAGNYVWQGSTVFYWPCVSQCAVKLNCLMSLYLMHYYSLYSIWGECMHDRIYTRAYIISTKTYQWFCVDDHQHCQNTLYRSCRDKGWQVR